MTDPGTPEDLSDNSPIFRPSANRLQMFVDNDWPQPVICNAETERADKKARRRISKSFFLNKCGLSVTTRQQHTYWPAYTHISVGYTCISFEYVSSI